VVGYSLETELKMSTFGGTKFSFTISITSAADHQLFLFMRPLENSVNLFYHPHRHYNYLI